MNKHLKRSIFIILGITLFGCDSPEEKLLKQTCDLIKQHAEIAMQSRQNNNLDRNLGVMAYLGSDTFKILREGQPIVNDYIIKMIDSAYDIPVYSNLNDKEQAVRTFAKEQEKMCYKSFVLESDKRKSL